MFDLLVMRISKILVTLELSREDAGWFGSRPHSSRKLPALKRPDFSTPTYAHYEYM
jgi:hypothetical protein